METEVEIRPAAADDLDRLLALYQALNPADPALPFAQASQAFSRMLSQPGMTIFVAERGERLVSTATLIVLPNLTRKARPYGLIENVVTLADLRGSGLGRAVVRHAIKAGFAADCYKVMLMTGRGSAKVHRFYESCGFIQNKTGFQIRDD